MDKNQGIKNNIKVIAFTIISLLVVVLLFAVTNRAVPVEERAKEDAVLGGAFEVASYDMDVSVKSDHSYEVDETLSVVIPKQVQNIVFSIPSGNFRITDIDVEGVAYYSDISVDSSRIVIVDPIQLSQGEHTYRIRYTVREFQERDSSQDIFYFTALPPEWRQPIARVNINASFPDDFPWDDMQCYAGQFGVQDVNNKIKFEADGSAKTVSLSGEKIPENYGITLKADLPDGYWKGALNGGWVVTAITAIMDAVMLILILLWLIGGRDPKIPKTTETKPIDEIPPSEIGYIFNNEVSIRDILLLLLQFARKGYLAISEYEPKRYRIIRREDPVGEEKLYRNAYNTLFEDVYKDRAVEMEDLPERLLRIKNVIGDDIAAGYASEESSAFTTMSKIFRYVSGGLLAVALGLSNALSYRYEYLSINYTESIIIALIAAGSIYLLCRAVDKRESQVDERNFLMELLAAAITLGTIVYVASGVMRRIAVRTPSVAVAAASLISIFFVIIMRARGRDNANLVMRVRQLRNFIYHPTPKELLENYLADKNYYYDMLQYALTGGAEETWAISFITLDVPAPEWFSHDVEGHAYSNIREDETTVDYARDLKTFLRTMENAFADFTRWRHRR